MFKLSEQTSLELKSGTFTPSDKYVKLFRDGVKPRWMNFSLPTWLAFVGLHPTVCADMTAYPECDGEKWYEVLNNTQLKISRFNGILYAGFCQTRKGYTNIINLNMDEWKCIESAIATLEWTDVTSDMSTESLPSKKRKTVESTDLKTATADDDELILQRGDGERTVGVGVDVCGGTENHVLQQYQWSLQKRACEPYQRTLQTIPCDVIQMGEWTFLHEKCVASGEAYKAMYTQQGLRTSREPHLVINKRDQILPSAGELLKMTYTYLVRKEAHIIASKKCPGCVFQQEGQNEHMGPGGCLVDDPDLVDFYMKEACTQVSLRRAVDIIRTLCNK